MKTRYKEQFGRVIGGVLGFGAGAGLFALVSNLFDAGPNPIMFYIVAFTLGAAGAGSGGRLMVRMAGKTQITRGVYIVSPGWKETARGPTVVSLAKGDARLEVSLVEAETTVSPSAVLDSYAEKAGLSLVGESFPVTLSGPVVGLSSGLRHAFRGMVDWPPDEARPAERVKTEVEGELTVFTVPGAGLVFHGSAPSSGYAQVRSEIREVVASLERQ